MVKKVGDLFADLGFREDGSESVKRAFIENLVKAAHQSQPHQGPSRPVAPKATPQKTRQEEQLSFDFGDEPGTPFPLATRRSAG